MLSPGTILTVRAAIDWLGRVTCVARFLSLPQQSASLLVQSAAHAAGPVQALRVGNWSGGSYTNDKTGAFSHCVAERSSNNSGISFFRVRQLILSMEHRVRQPCLAACLRRNHSGGPHFRWTFAIPCLCDRADQPTCSDSNAEQLGTDPNVSGSQADASCSEGPTVRLQSQPDFDAAAGSGGLRAKERGLASDREARRAGY